jgi:hypothetical protein
VPTPFEKGDIITTGKEKAVINYMCNKDKRFLKLIEDGPCGDSSDMIYNGYYYNSYYRKIELDHIGYYDEFEYCTEELKGYDRILKAISNLMKNKINIELFMIACNYIKAEEMLKDERKYLTQFLDEWLELVGLNKEKKVEK